MGRLLTALSLTIFMNVAVAHAASIPIYVYKDKGGAMHFTNHPPPDGTQAQVWTAKNANFSVFRVEPIRTGKVFKNVYNDIIAAASAAEGLGAGLIKAVIHAESAFNPKAVSARGAQGLMQIMPETASLLGVTNVFDPRQNIYAGTRYLAFLLRKYDGNLRLALAAYNAGPGAVEQFNGVPPFSETQQYVQRVLDLKEQYDRSTGRG